MSDDRLDDRRAVALLRAGDEQAFEALVARHYATMMAVARTYVNRERWPRRSCRRPGSASCRGLDRFEGRSSLKTWIIAIVVNKAKTRAQREGRSVPFARLRERRAAVEPERFRGRGDTYAGHWRSSPAELGRRARRDLAGPRDVRVAMRAIADLPPVQQTVIRMRDLEGSSAEEVCSALDDLRGEPARPAAPGALARARRAGGSSRCVTIT